MGGAQAGDVLLSFLEENVNLSPATRQNLLDIFENLQDLRLEHAGIHIAKSRYSLEGDGPWIFSCYEQLSALLKLLG